MSTGGYDDGLIALDGQAITLRRYHFPSGTSKVIPLGAIRGYQTQPLGMLIHRLCLWGSADLRRWLPLDACRMLRTTLVTLDVAGTWPHPACTPAEPAGFLALLDELLEPGS